MMDGKEKLYFLLDAIEDARTISPSGQSLRIDPTNDLNRNYRDFELNQLFTKLEKDEKILEVLKASKRVNSALGELDPDPYDHADDGCWHIKLLPSFDSYYLKIQYEPQYQEFTGKKPPAVSRNKLSRKALEKIWGVLQEIEDKRGITSAQDDISIPLVHFSKVKDDMGANNASDERRNVLRKLENEENAIRDVRLPDNLREYVYLKIGDRYFETFDYYKNEYKEAANSYQQEQQAQQALRPVMLPRYGKPASEKVSPREIVSGFSSQNYPFVLRVLKQIALFAEFSINDKISYQLQSLHGQQLIQERALLDKFQSKGLFKNLGEDGIFGIATLSDIDIDLIKQVIAEIESKSSGAKNKYEKLIEEMRKPSQPSLQERYDKLVEEIRPKLQKNNRRKIKKPNIKAEPSCEWSEDFKWQGNKQFVFGEYGVVNFNSQSRIHLFRELTKAKGGWVTVKKLKEITGKNDSFVRPTIGQIERSMKAELKKHISFPSTGEDNLQPKPSQGAYRIKFTPKSL